MKILIEFFYLGRKLDGVMMPMYDTEQIFGFPSRLFIDK